MFTDPSHEDIAAFDPEVFVPRRVSAVLPVFGRARYPIAELSGMASWSLGERLDALRAEQDVEDAFEDALEFDGMCS